MKKKKKINRKKINWKAVAIAGSILSWVGLIYIIISIPPTRWEDIYYLPFFINLTLSLALTTWIFTNKLAPIILTPASIVVILLLRLFNFTDWYYPILIIAITISLIYFFTTPQEDGNVPPDNSIDKTKK